MRSYRAFISYSHQDEASARRLHRRLETFRPPKLDDELALARLSPVFRDRDELATSSDLGGRIEEALAASENLIVLCSPKAAASEWVNEEIRRFVALHGAGAVHAVIVGGRPPECFPPALLEATPEPLAADLTEDHDGFEDGALKLIAGVLDAPFGILKDREAARARRRMRLALAAVAAFAALGVFASWQAWRAAEAQARAEAELARAEAAIGAAVDGVEGVVTELADDTRRGRIHVDAATELLERSGEVSRRVLSLAPERPELTATHGALLNQLAESLIAAGVPGEAHTAAGDALAAFEASGQPHGEGAVRARLSLGDAARDRGDTDAAGRFYATAEADARAADGLQDLLADALDRGSDLSARRGDLATAIELASEETRIRRPTPDSRLANALGNLGRLQEAAGDASAAADLYREALAVAEAWAADAPQDADRARALSASLADPARLARAAGDLGGALDLTRRRLDVDLRLHRNDPRNTTLTAALAASFSELAAIYVDTGARADATTALERAAELTIDLAALNPDDPSLGLEVMRRKGELGDLALANGARKEALAHYAVARRAAEEAARRAPDDPATVLSVTDMWERAARVHLEEGDSGGAIMAAKEGYWALQPLLEAENPPPSLTVRAARNRLLAARGWALSGKSDNTVPALQMAMAGFKPLLARRVAAPDDQAAALDLADAWMARAAVMTLMGGKNGLGNQRKALEEARKLVQPIFLDNAENNALKLRYARILVEIGANEASFGKSGDPMRVTANLGYGGSLVKELLTAAPDAADLLTLQAKTAHGWGDSSRAQGYPQEAAKQYLKAERTWRALVERDPGRAPWRESLMLAIAWRAVVDPAIGPTAWPEVAELGRALEAEDRLTPKGADALKYALKQLRK